MSQKKILHILQQVQEGSLSPEDAMLQLKMEPFQDLGFAKVDHHRGNLWCRQNHRPDYWHRRSHEGARTGDHSHNADHGRDRK